MKHTLLTATLILASALTFAQYSGAIGVHPPSSSQSPKLGDIIKGLENDGMNGNVILLLYPGDYGDVSIGKIPRIGNANKKLTIRPVQSLTTATFEYLEMAETHYTELRDLKFNSGNRPHAIYAENCQRLRIFDCDFVSKNTAIEIRDPETYTLVRRCSFHNTSSNASGYATSLISFYSAVLTIYYQDNIVTGGFKYGALLTNYTAGKNYVLNNDVLLNQTGAAYAMDVTSNGGQVWLNRNILTSEGPEGNGNTEPVASVFFQNGSYGELTMENNMISGPRSSMRVSNGEAHLRHNSMNSHSGTGMHFVNSEVVFENNIVKALAQLVFSDASTIFTQINNNLYRSIYSSSTPFGLYPSSGGYQGITYSAWKALSRDVNSIFGEPQFYSPFDLHINSNSPAVGRGFVVGNINYDIEGDLRSTKVDLGADELPGKKSINNRSVARQGVANLIVSTYPNPSNGQFQLFAEVGPDANYSVLDMQGRVVAQGVFQKGLVTLQDIAPGQYLIQVIEGQRLGTTSIIIE